MRFVNRRGVRLALGLVAAIVLGMTAAPRAEAGGLYHWWNGHVINKRATLAKDYRTGGVYYAPPIPYGEYTKNYASCIHEAAGLAHGLIGKVCSACKGLGCGLCGGLGCLHGNSCGSCGGAGCNACGGNGLLAGGGHGHGGHGHGHAHAPGTAVVGGPAFDSGLGGLGSGCGLCGNGPMAATGHTHGGKALPAVAAGNLASSQSLPSSQSYGRACSLCGGLGRLGDRLCGGCAGQGKIYGLVTGAQCGLCGGSGKHGAGLCGGCGGAGLLSGLKCGTCGGCGIHDGHGCGTCGGRGVLACAENGAGAVHHLANKAAGAVHHVKNTASGLAHQAMWKMGKGGVEYFVGPGGPVPITPGYVNYVVPVRSPRDFFAFPPFVDQAFNSASYTAPLYQEPTRSTTNIVPAAPIDQVRQSSPFPVRNNADVNVPTPPMPGGADEEVPVPPAPDDVAR